jgi:hypothetical protein
MILLTTCYHCQVQTETPSLDSAHMPQSAQPDVLKGKTRRSEDSLHIHRRDSVHYFCQQTSLWGV